MLGKKYDPLAPITFSMNAHLSPPKVSGYFRVKWYFDIIVVLLTAPIIVPTILVFMLLVKLTSRGPVFYAQTRLSKDDKPFEMYKIRSMTVDAESVNRAKWTARQDARVTLIGKIMRPLHIDELPQIWNVLRGEMAVIGPRPERPEFVEKLSAEIPGYSYRTLILPGLTGYAQLNLPSDTGLGDVRKKLVLDLEYIERASLFFDILLLLGTALMVFPKRYFGTWPNRLCGIHRNVEDSSWADQLGVGNFDDSNKDTDSKILRPRNEQ